MKSFISFTWNVWVSAAFNIILFRNVLQASSSNCLSWYLQIDAAVLRARQKLTHFLHTCRLNDKYKAISSTRTRIGRTENPKKSERLWDHPSHFECPHGISFLSLKMIVRFCWRTEARVRPSTSYLRWTGSIAQGNEVRPTPMPRTMKLSTMSSNSSSNSSDSSSVTNPLVLPICENLTDFIGRDVFAERLTGYQLDNKNITCLEHAPKLTRAIYLKVIVLAIISVLSLVGNLATIYSIRKNRRRQRGCSAIYTLILHLSVADLLVTIFCLAGDAIWSYSVEWLWGNAACKIFKFLQMFSLYLSTFILVLIGVDRFVAVRYPMKGLNKSQKCSRFVLLAWLLSFVLATPQVRQTGGLTYFSYKLIEIDKLIET